MKEKYKSKTVKIIEHILFGIVILISLLVMGVVLWINFKDWMK